MRVLRGREDGGERQHERGFSADMIAVSKKGDRVDARHVGKRVVGRGGAFGGCVGGADVHERGGRDRTEQGWDEGSLVRAIVLAEGGLRAARKAGGHCMLQVCDRVLVRHVAAGHGIGCRERLVQLDEHHQPRDAAGAGEE